MEFVGRQIELRLLRSQFDEALRGHPRLAIIEGPAGIGKTALVDRFLSEYGDVQVLRASGEEYEGSLGDGGGGPVRGSPAGPSAMPRQAPLEDHLIVGAQVLDLLGHLQERGPVILVIDDLHWADQTSLKALLFGLRRLQADRVLALLVMRSEETHRLPEGLSRLIHSGVAARQQLRGLESADLRELAALMGVGALSAGAAERLYQHTEGNPLSARALLAELPTEIWRIPELTVPAPHSFSLLVLRRRAQRSQETRQLLDAASVLGMHSSLDLAARLADIAAPLAAVDEASAAGLLQIEQVGKREIAFPHPLVEATIYHGLSMSERARLHARAATLGDDQASYVRPR